MNGEQRILNERLRQIRVEGYGETHDDAHDKGQIYLAAKAYLEATHRTDLGEILENEWPWEAYFFKPYMPRSTVSGEVVDTEKCLIKAGALILAEQDRLSRVLSDIQSQLDRNFPQLEEAIAAAPKAPAVAAIPDNDISF